MQVRMFDYENEIDLENAINEFKESVKEYLDDPYGDYQISEIEESIAEEFKNSIDDVFTNIENELDQGPSDKIGKTLSTDFTEKTQIRQQFLDKYFISFNITS